MLQDRASPGARMDAGGKGSSLIGDARIEGDDDDDDEHAPMRPRHASARAAVPAAVQPVVQAARQRGVPLRVLAIGAAQPVAGADAHLPDAAGRMRLRYAVPADGAAYLLRPDQHVCARWLALDAQRLQTALTTALPV